MIPAEIQTPRLLLRAWHEDHAERLQPILVANVDYLRDWIPKHVWEPVEVPELRRRLAGYHEKFNANIEWRYGAFSPDGTEIVGSVGLFPRDATERVPAADADRGEIGYWIRRDRSGEGLATELTKAMIALAGTLPAFHSIEIRCNALNAASAAVPRRLGFVLSATTPHTDGPGADQVWTAPISLPTST